MNPHPVPRDISTNRPIIETTEGAFARVSYSATVEGAQREAATLDRTAERMGLKVRYRVRGNHA